MNDIVERIDRANHIVVISHVNPDADSIGSASAIYSYMLQKHKKVSWYCKSKRINTNLSFIPWFDNIRDSFPSSADLAISLDCGDKRRLGIDLECDLINIDHHSSNDNYGNYNMVDCSAISTSYVVFNFLKTNSVKINSKMATAIYAGILDDSNGFISDDVDGTTFATVGELIEYGADYKLCNKKIMKSMSLAALRLKAKMLANMTLELDAKVAFFCVKKDDMLSTGAVGEDCEVALEESLYLPHVEVSVLLKENIDYSIKGSIRSNSKIDASGIATIFSGGGHHSRAGFNLGNERDIYELRDEILNLIKKEM